MTMLVLAASAALLMGTVGLYALVSFTVGQRTREIGVRMALGARASDIRRMVLAEGAALAVVGVTIGAVAALSVGRLFASLVHEISPSDPATLVVMSAVLLAVALGAAYIPARRAAALEPTVTIRSH
jgi:ABC-type antimicrobial peptide transport system permease subunit